MLENFPLHRGHSAFTWFFTEYHQNFTERKSPKMSPCSTLEGRWSRTCAYKNWSCSYFPPESWRRNWQDCFTQVASTSPRQMGQVDSSGETGLPSRDLDFRFLLPWILPNTRKTFHYLAWPLEEVDGGGVRSPWGSASGVGGQDRGEEGRVGVPTLEDPSSFSDSSSGSLLWLTSSGSSHRLLAFSFSASTSRSDDFSMSRSTSKEEFWSEGWPPWPPSSILTMLHWNLKSCLKQIIWYGSIRSWNIGKRYNHCLATPPRGNRIAGLKVGTQKLPEGRSRSKYVTLTFQPVEPIRLEMILANKNPFWTGCRQKMLPRVHVHNVAETKGIQVKQEHFNATSTSFLVHELCPPQRVADGEISKAERHWWSSESHPSWEKKLLLYAGLFTLPFIVVDPRWDGHAKPMASHTMGTKDCKEEDELPVFRLHHTHSIDWTTETLSLFATCTMGTPKSLPHQVHDIDVKW